MVNCGTLNLILLFVVNILLAINAQMTPIVLHTYHHCFLKCTKKKQVNIEQQSNRYIRKTNRQGKKLKMVINDVKSTEVEIIEALQCENLNCVSNVGIQVMFDFNNTNPFKFECEFNKYNNDVETLANTSLSNNICNNSNTKDIACGPDISCLNMDSFLGYHYITNEAQLKDLTSTTVKVFNLLLSFMSDSCYSTVSKENRLFLNSQMYVMFLKPQLRMISG
ncbi:hypothetical protein AGLY_004273 [Aphis glycines]|uniref:Uncharacterized protein n=1 Tax=Aphis glycines TaxID=307491 RepID=A0A6G0TY01_APHGL|nr:hypothetical protein AGLY_004273 [Aphis glycines]